jgi:hypothetical protein
VVDGNGLQNLKKFRIGESVREECVENSDWPTSEVIEIIVSCREKRIHPIDISESIVFFCSYLSCEIRECIETCNARCFSMKYVDFSILAGKTCQNHFVFIDTHFPENYCFERVHYLVCKTCILLSFIVILVAKMPLPGLPK